MTKLYRILIVTAIVFLLVYVYPDYWIHISSGFIVYILIEFVNSDLKCLQTPKEKIHKYKVKIYLKIFTLKKNYSKYEQIMMDIAVQNAKSDDEEKARTGREQMAQFKNLKTKRILWVESDGDILEDLVKPLKKEGHNVIIAKNRKKAIELIENFEFELILCEVLIPSGEGIESDILSVGMQLLEKLLIEKKIETPIVVLSLVNDNNEVKRMKDMGVKKVLLKSAHFPAEIKKEIYKVLGV